MPTTPHKLQPATLTVAASNAKSTLGYDYVCDGTGDQVEINAAIVALPAGGGRIVLSEGTFTLGSSTPITINKSNVVLEGQGIATFITIPTAFNADVIEVGSGATAFNDIVVRNLSIDGNVANQTTNGHGIDVNIGVTYAVVEGCRIENTYKANIFLNDSANAAVRNNILNVSSPDGSWANIEGGGDYFLVKGNTCTAGGYGAIAAYLGDWHIISENICFNPLFGETIYAWGDASQIVNNYVSNNSPGDDEGAIWSSSNKSGLVDANIIYLGTDGNYGVRQNSQYGTVSNNFINFVSSSTSDAGLTSAAIYCDNPHQSITDNVILLAAGITGDQLVVIGSFDTSVVSGNLIHSGTTRDLWGIYANNASTAITGNYIEGTTGDVGIWSLMISGTISDNQIYDCSTGILCTVGDESGQITNNVLSGIGSRGIDLQEKMVGFQIMGNFIQGQGAATNEGIFIGEAVTLGDVSRRNVISGNTIYNFGKEGIKAQNFSYNTITGNCIEDVGQTTTGTYSAILLKTGGAPSTNNVINGNSIQRHLAGNRPRYGIREDTPQDGPNMILGNVVMGALVSDIMIKHPLTDDSHNIVGLVGQGVNDAFEAITISESVTIVKNEATPRLPSVFDLVTITENIALTIV